MGPWYWRCIPYDEVHVLFQRAVFSTDYKIFGLIAELRR